MKLKRYISAPPPSLRWSYFATIFFGVAVAALSSRALFAIVTIILTDPAVATQASTLANIALNRFDFIVSVTIGLAGGVVSFLHEAKTLDWPRTRIFSAVIGHLFTAMFSAVVAYFLAIYFEVAEVMGWAASALAGFGGYPFLRACQDSILRLINKRFGLDSAEPQPVPVPAQTKPQPPPNTLS